MNAVLSPESLVLIAVIVPLVSVTVMRRRPPSAAMRRPSGMRPRPLERLVLSRKRPTVGDGGVTRWMRLGGMSEKSRVPVAATHCGPSVNW